MVTEKGDLVKKVLLIAGGNLDIVWAKSWLKGKVFDKIFVADSGLYHALALGLQVDNYFGDCDSFSQGEIETYKNSVKDFVILPTEKNDTDTEYALKKAIEVGAKEISIIAATGNRLDHTFTSIFLLLQLIKNENTKSNNVDIVIYDANNKIYVRDSDFSIRKKEQYADFVSFVAISKKVELSLKGFKYNLEKGIINWGSSLLQSNEIKEDIAYVNLYKGIVIVFESRD